MKELFTQYPKQAGLIFTIYSLKLYFRKCGLPVSLYMDRNQQDLIGNQTNFITKIVKPCFESLAYKNFLTTRYDSIISQQLEENLLTWEYTNIDEDGQLQTPSKEEVKRHLADIMARHRAQLKNEENSQKTEKIRRKTLPNSENDSLIDEVHEEDESWSDRNNGLMQACCAPLFSIFRRKNRSQRYRE